MNYWHMQLHPGEFNDWEVEDIKQLLKRNLIGCAGEPIHTFNGIKIGDCVMIRQGGTVVAIVNVLECPRSIFPEEKVEGVWFDQCAKVKILRFYSGLSVSGVGWYLPKTLMIVENEIAYKFINKLYMDYTNETQVADLIDLLTYKKQIILQGPPGTGKTRMAKQLANLICADFVLNNSHKELILNSFVPNMTLKTFEGKEFTISEINSDNTFKLKIGNDNPYSVTIDQIIKIDNDENTNIGGRSYASAMAKFAKNRISENQLLNDQIKLIQFHPSYTYEDFVRGIVVKLNENNQPNYEVENKILAKFSNNALNNPSINYVIIIDEINRANLPSVLGELIYALEYRNEAVDSMYSIKGVGNKITLPLNLYIIGTMNTADRSVGHIDYAIRRRFAFVDILPSSSPIDEVVLEPSLNLKAKLLYNKVEAIFNEDKSEGKIVYLQSDFKAREVQLGHSYFLVESEEQLNLKLNYEIKPLLMEYVKDGILNESATKIIAEL